MVKPGRWILNKAFFLRGPPPLPPPLRGPTPYPSIYIIFNRKGTPFVYLSLTNSTPFTYLVWNFAVPSLNCGKCTFLINKPQNRKICSTFLQRHKILQQHFLVIVQNEMTKFPVTFHILQVVKFLPFHYAPFGVIQAVKAIIGSTHLPSPLGVIKVWNKQETVQKKQFLCYHKSKTKSYVIKETKKDPNHAFFSHFLF